MFQSRLPIVNGEDLICVIARIYLFSFILLLGYDLILTCTMCLQESLKEKPMDFLETTERGITEWIQVTCMKTNVQT